MLANRRFVPALRGDGVDVVIGVFKALCILGGELLSAWAAEACAITVA